MNQQTTKPGVPRRGSQTRNNGQRSRGNNGGSESKNFRGRGAAARANRRKMDDVSKMLNRHSVTPVGRTNANGQNKPAKVGSGMLKNDTIRIVPLGGQDDVGSKNMIVVEYGNDAIVMDCGNNLSVDLPGINYTVPDITYLEQIKHKIRAYVISHGHLDHIAGLPHVVPQVPAPIYGTKFTIGMVEKQFDSVEQTRDFALQTVVMNEDNHEKLKIGPFFIELVRVTHSIPGSALIVVETPVGRIVNTGDFRLDPEPLDDKPTDLDRIKEIGKDGVLLLMSESTATQKPGRTPTEDTLVDSYKDIIAAAPGRVFIAMFSSNTNRMQMVIDGAVNAGRKVAIDGRSMMATMELALKLGFIKIPRGAIVSMKDVERYKEDELVLVVTGSQGEENASLSRMASGEHNNVKMKPGDTVVLASTPIPGNEVSFARNASKLMRLGAMVFQHRLSEIQPHGPLHVSGHASRDEYREMIDMVKPKYFMPIYGEYQTLKFHADLALEEGLSQDNIFLLDNGDVMELTESSAKINGKVPTGSVLVDNTGAVVPDVVVKDRVLMSEDGIVVIMLTIDRKNGQLLTSPDIITRGFIYMRESEDLMRELRDELKRFALRRGTRVEPDRFKQELRDDVSTFLYNKTNRSPIVIPVANFVGSSAPQGRQQSRSNPRQNNRQGNKPQQKPKQAQV